VTSRRESPNAAPATDVATQINVHLARTGLFSAPRDLASLDDMVLAPQIRRQLTRIVAEQGRRAELRARSLRPSRKLLFSGRPGTGKTMAAGALARALKLPMFRVESHGVFSRFFAESAQRLAKVFENVRMVPAVYLFDEFDSMAADRAAIGSESDGGEARRVVNALLQFIEGDQSDSVIIAATNHAQMLDSAIFRRFDEMVVFDPLTKEELMELVRRMLDGFPIESLDFDEICRVNPELGHADLCAALNQARKDHVLEGAPISTKSVVEGLSRRTTLLDGISRGRR